MDIVGVVAVVYRQPQLRRLCGGGVVGTGGWAVGNGHWVMGGGQQQAMGAGGGSFAPILFENCAGLALPRLIPDCGDDCGDIWRWDGDGLPLKGEGMSEAWVILDTIHTYSHNTHGIHPGLAQSSLYSNLSYHNHISNLTTPPSTLGIDESGDKVHFLGPLVCECSLLFSSN
ncbi:hypothetical protein RIF29_10987 [Crotalaria pallida]|uniref:Uncharacterized protein n=1 Tax=Crotalaria pallida TaxID=3830 RepID=A0AAN9FTA7_CROPI